MQKFYFTPDAIDGVKIQLVRKVDIVDPETAQVTPGTIPVKILDKSNGFLGVFPKNTKLQLKLQVEGEHECYILDQKTLEKISKRVEVTGEYIKNFTVTAFEDRFTAKVTIAAWPANMVCLEISGHTYNIGLVNQNGRFFFVIEEYLPSPENLPEGMVIWFSLLRGIGAVTCKPMFDARIHWSNLRFNRHDGLRLLKTGDLLEWETEDVVDLGGDTSFRYEIKHCVNLSASK
jgi:hypothetical protein